MSKVYLHRVPDRAPPAVWARAAARVLSAIESLSFPEKNDLAAIKLHVGEPGVSTYLPPEIAAEAARFVKDRGARPFLTDTSVLYSSPRSTGVGHSVVASEHGFTVGTTGAPFIAADGLKGNAEVEVAIQGVHFKAVGIAREIAEADAMIVVSHATGHLAAGFGATIKNLGMGCASRKGKLLQHSDTKPFVKGKKCNACGACLEACPANALSAQPDGIAILDVERCTGCGECLAQCRYDAIGFRWDTAPVKMQEKMAEHALGVVQALGRKVVYLLGIVSLTKDCDCLAPGSAIVARDVGFAASLDPVALDQAAMDLIAKAEGQPLDRIAYPKIDGAAQLTHAERVGLGSREYTLVEVRG